MSVVDGSSSRSGRIGQPVRSTAPNSAINPPRAANLGSALREFGAAIAGVILVLIVMLALETAFSLWLRFIQ